MKLKKFALLLVCAILLVSNSVIHTEAATGMDIIQPYYTTISSAKVKLENTNGLLTLQTEVNAKQKSNLSITMTLQKRLGLSWIIVETWSGSKTDALKLILSKTYTASKGTTYRVASKVTAGSETTTVYSETVTY